MNKENFVIQLQEFLESKGLTKQDAEKYLIEVFKKAFEKDKDALSKYEEEDPEPANVEIDIDMESGNVSIKRLLVVVKEKTILSRFRQIELEDERLNDLGLNIGDLYTEVIDLNKINIGRIQHIKQLFLQKLSEAEKIKVYNKFSKYKGELLNAKIHRVLNKGNVILDYEGDSIFMPAAEISPLDRSKIIEGKPLSVYILEIEELSKDAQIIASRKSPGFIGKLIEREIEDVADGVVLIQAVAREAGFKTKVAVSTTLPEVDAVGSIIGVKGQKIKPIVDEIGGERLDIIKYHENIKQFIAEALLPAEITGIKVVENEEGWREATVVVEQDQFLPAIGKRGINIKLAAILTKSKIDVKTIAEANAEGIIWEKIAKTKYVSQNNEDFMGSLNFEEYDTIEEMGEAEGNDYTVEDYNLDDNFGMDTFFESETELEEETYDPEYDEEFGQ